MCNTIRKQVKTKYRLLPSVFGFQTNSYVFHTWFRSNIGFLWLHYTGKYQNLVGDNEENPDL